MERLNLPKWASDGTSDVQSPLFSDLAKTLDMTISALAAANRLAPDVPGPSATDEMLRLYGRGRDLIRTLLTICRAHLGLNPTDGASVAARSRLLARREELDRAAARALAAVRAMPEPGSDAEADRHYDTYPEIRRWKLYVSTLPTSSWKEFSGASLMREAMTPLYALHTHMTSTMSLAAEDSGRHVRRQSFGMSLSILRNGDDPVLRRTTFEAMNAWFASHANAFADLLNAISGLRVAIWRASGAHFPEVHLQKERTSVEAYRAMLNALDEALPEVRRSVTIRARMAMKTKNGEPDPKTLPCHLTAPLPGALWTRGSTYADHLRDLITASANVDPSFGVFLREAHEKHWVDGRNFASKTGSSWCDDLPSLGAVRILTHFYPNLESEVRVAHLFGVAHHLRLLHGASPAARLFPLSVTEIAGKFYEALLLRQLRKEAEGTGNESLRLSVYWLDLSRITNFLLTIPARHRLLGDIYRERLFGALSVRTLNELSDAAWHHYFGDTTIGADRYVWAYKPHFYRQETIAYDWQYVFGYLLGDMLADRFEKESLVSGGVRKLWAESGLLSTDELIRKWLGDDPRSSAFWRKCIEKALKPVREQTER